MSSTVLLRHEVPDGSWHYDWLIAREESPVGAEDRVLVAFRVGVRPDESARFDAVRLEDHRVAYLTHEGPVSGGRGRVECVARGEARIERESEDEFVVRVDFGTGARVLRGVRVGGESGEAAPKGAWEFEAG